MTLHVLKTLLTDITHLSFIMQSLERCQLKEVVASKPEKLDASGLNLLNIILLQYDFIIW